MLVEFGEYRTRSLRPLLNVECFQILQGSSAQSTHFQWGLGQETGRPNQRLDSVDNEPVCMDLDACFGSLSR